MEEALLTTKEIAVFLNVKESTIRYWVHIGYIPRIKFRGAVRFNKPEIIEWLKTCTSTQKRIAAEHLSRAILRNHRCPPA